MSSEKKYTERDLILAQRRAWDECAHRISVVGQGSVESEELKNRLYPIPKKTVPRTERVGALEYRLVDGELQWRTPGVGGSWLPENNSILWYHASTQLLEMLLRLRANPTVEVDDE